jgi:hypothetical protein
VHIPDPVSLAKHQIFCRTTRYDLFTGSLVLQTTAGRRDVAESVVALRFIEVHEGTISGTFTLYRRSRIPA